MKRHLLLIAIVPFAFVAPAWAQSMESTLPGMPGMKMPMAPKAAATPRRATKAAGGSSNPSVDPRTSGTAPAMMGMDMTGGTPDAQAGHDMPEMPGMNSQGLPVNSKMQLIDQPVGAAPVPAAPTDHAADRFYSPDEMAITRAALKEEHGGHTFSSVMVNLNEMQVQKGKVGYRWDGEAWFGGDIDRLVLKSEGDGSFQDRLGHAEVQALYSRAVDPYWNLQAGIRQDFKPDPSRTDATVGVEGRTPYGFELSGVLFLSNKGDVLGRFEGYYDQRITQRLILQPRAELNFAIQNVPEDEIGSGLSDAELGLRVRYEITREFAPYIGVSYDRKVGDTARFARSKGDDTGSAGFVFGIRSSF